MYAQNKEKIELIYKFFTFVMSHSRQIAKNLLLCFAKTEMEMRQCRAEPSNKHIFESGNLHNNSDTIKRVPLPYADVFLYRKIMRLIVDEILHRENPTFLNTLDTKFSFKHSDGINCFCSRGSLNKFETTQIVYQSIMTR